MIRTFWMLSALSLLSLLSACASGGSGAKASSGAAKCDVASDVCAKLSPAFADAQGVAKNRCVSCHSPDGEAGAEHDFTSDSIMQAHKKKIAAELSSCSMPPAGAPALTDQERAAIECWATAP